jgi:hypothetical protein
MKKVCVVIPVHSADPSDFELMSFIQCFKILDNRPIYIIAPEGLNLAVYKKEVGTFQTIYIDPKWQSSLLFYNKLKTSRFFYDLFDQYTYMLTYELDAFIFRDDLDYWCDKGYDYIGAPWFEGYVQPISDRLIGVGNSGFSLRNIKFAQKALKKIYYRDPDIYFGSRAKRWWANLVHPIRWLFNQGKENYSIQNTQSLYEDAFFCYIIPSKFNDFKIAPVEQALKFSFEVKPEYLYQLNDQALPMGCHAWYRYNLDFWKPFIQDQGYSIR